MNISDTLLAVLSFGCFFVVVVLLIVLGWYFVWKLFLSRFRFVRELIGGMTDVSALKDTKSRSRTRRD